MFIPNPKDLQIVIEKDHDPISRQEGGSVKRRFVLIFVCVLLAAPYAFARTINGTGFGPTLQEARKEAIAELSQSIHVEVKSEFSSIQTQTNSTLDEMKTKTLHLKSDLPIIGVRYSEPIFSSEGFMVDAVLDASARPLYEKELAKITDVISKNLTNSQQKITRATKVELYKTLLTQIDQYYKIRIVAQFLACTSIPDSPVTAADIQGRLLELEKKADTLNFGATILAKNFTGHTVFIYPPTPVQSNEVTQFGRAVKDHLASKLTTTNAPRKADMFLIGSYTVLKNGIELTCHLLDKNHKTVKTGLVFFLPQAYAGYKVEPLALDFEKLIQDGHVVSGDFHVDIKTKKGRKDLLYTQGESMSLMVKMNRPGYFYLVSHNFKDDGKYSYIINFTDEPDNRKFVYYAGGDAVNKWVELGEFVVVPPFGVETLQVVASTQDLVDQIPQNYYDPATQLYTIGTPKSETRGLPMASKPQEALATTRGLMLKKKTAKAEATLMFTSMKAGL